MSLIEDALKRQEELRAASSDQNIPTPKPTVARVSVPKPAAPKPTRVPQYAPPPENPFLKAEKERPRNRAAVLYMPILAIVVFLALLFLKREFVHERPTYTAPDINGIEPAIPVVARKVTIDEQIPVANTELDSAIAIITNDVTAANTTNQVEKTTDIIADINNTNFVSNIATNPPAPQVTTPTTSNAAVWPDFTLNGIALGREKLAILNSGEMLTAGDTAKCGVKVISVDTTSVTFTWNGEKKTLRKGEKSDKAAD